MFHDKRFPDPVYVLGGQQSVREIRSLHDALDFLGAWPADLREMRFAATERACLAAHDGRMPLDAARAAFAGWARRANILAEGAPALA